MTSWAEVENEEAKKTRKEEEENTCVSVDEEANAMLAGSAKC